MPILVCLLLCFCGLYVVVFCLGFVDDSVVVVGVVVAVVACRCVVAL